MLHPRRPVRACRGRAVARSEYDDQFNVLRLEYQHFTLDRARDAWYTTGLKVPVRGIDLMARYSRFLQGKYVQRTGASVA